MNVNEKVSPEKCFGCAACMNICPVQAITMPINDYGFYYPVIDNERCIGCGECARVCPALDNRLNNITLLNKKVYMARSDNDFTKSQSGGIFSVIAKYVIDNGGYVVGVKYNQYMIAVFDIADTMEKVDEFRRSKYNQAYAGDIYSVVKDKLEEGKMVLFTGLPCQVSGLYHVLGDKSYSNLYTIDLWCHGVPSSKLWQEYVHEQDDYGNIINANFFDKNNPESPYKTTFVKKGENIVKKSTQEWYWRNFVENGLNAPCETCKFAMESRVGDITIGDLWSAIKNPELDEYIIGKIPPSFIIGNNDNGLELIKKVSDKFNLFQEIPYSYITDKNRILPVPINKEKRNALLKEYNIKPMETYDFNKNVCLYGLTENVNYGGLITYYALYRAIENLGYTCYMIPRSSSVTKESNLHRYPDERTIGSSFCKENCRMAPRLKYEDFSKYNALANTFVLGSDMIWNHYMYKPWADYTFYLDFVEDGKNKIACGSSFGSNEIDSIYHGYENDIETVSKLLKRFNSIAVRELSGKEILNNEFGISNVEQVLDPVFYIDKDEYIALANKARTKYLPGEFVATYFPSRRKSILTFMRDIEDEINLPVINITVDYPDMLEQQGRNPEDADDMYQWLYNMKYSKYVITSSFHAVCFCLIFNKPFVFLKDKWCLTRLDTLNELFSISNNIIDINKYMYDINTDIEQIINQPIDWDVINDKVKFHTERSIEWLKKAIQNNG